MIVDELIARLGFKSSGQSEARKFIRQLEQIKKAAKDAGKGMNLNFSGKSTGLDRMAADAQRATVALQRLRREAMRPLRVNGFGGGLAVGPGGYLPLSRRGLGRGRAGHGSAAGKIGAGEVAQREFLSGAGAGYVASRGTGAAGALLGGLAAASATKSSMSFERGMIDVQKATDATPQQYKDYEEFILKLARKTGKSKEELASLLASGGFAGRPQGELRDFTEYGAKAAVAWRTTPDETGQGLAEIGNIFGVNQKRIEEIGDAINTAADKSASKEADLLEYIRRVGASGKLSGISAEELLAFGAAMKEVGVRTDVAATGMEAFMNVMKLGEEFSKNAGDGLKELGYDSTKMRKAFNKAPVEEMMKMLDKLNKVADPLKRSEIMVNLFGKEYQDDIAKLMNAVPRLKELLELLRDPKKSQGSVREQFDKQLEFDVSKIDQAKQSTDVLQTRVGNYIKRGLGVISEVFNGAIDGLEGEAISPQQREGMTKKLNAWLGVSPLRTSPGITADEFSQRFGSGATARGTFGSLTDRMKWGAAAGKMPGAPSFGSLSDRLNWAKTGTQQATGVTNTINNTNTGNDQRTQSVTVNQTVNGVPGVASAAAEGAKSGLASMGASVAKANSTPTAGSTAP
ncbi:phage tail tape measure protein [Methylobacterium terricola]|uniref:Phage tail tape measure protein n=1 Tax=Methylobacterium terricola TaxID=2583531 RepID=A0A5C4LLJ5_9HYPH|nr:phage tail tape measure protein [Methylobacterium terricola]TNC14923.1 phage tail tape measure protein [Methylobacterium terricola]